MFCKHANYLILFAFIFNINSAVAADKVSESSLMERGKYILQTSGCHDCHTLGYPEAAGQVPEDIWLTGSIVGFQGPWGTSYPSNLRLTVQNLTEEQWLLRARQPMLPPMPWFSLRDMTDADLKAMYYVIRSMGPAGERAPVAVAPGVRVETPYFDFVPKNLPVRAAAQR